MISFRVPFTSLEIRSMGKKAQNQANRNRKDLLGGLGSATANWISLATDLQCLQMALENPILLATLQIKANARASARLKFRDIKTKSDIDPRTTRRADIKSIYNLLQQPNPLQSYTEWMFTSELNYGIFGNSFDYAALPDGFNTFDYSTITSIKQLPPYLTNIVPTGYYFDQTQLEGIIARYELMLSTGIKEFSTMQVLHRRESNIKFDHNFFRGTSKMVSLAMPLTNIIKAYESRNVIIRKRGALGVFTSNMKGVDGSYPLLDQDMEAIQADFKKYGTLDDQFQYLFTRYPLLYQKTTMNIEDLKLFEEVATDAMVVCNAYGVPEVLLKLYLQGATFENQEASVRRHYQSTIIPEAESFDRKFNRWLKMEEGGFEIYSSFDHIPALQADQKAEADTYNVTSTYYKELFFAGACTYADWKRALDLEVLPEDDIRIWDLDEQKLAVILKKATPPAAENTAQESSNN